MFSAFLSKDMTYSCAIFKDLDGDLKRMEEIGETNGALGLIKFGKGHNTKPNSRANGDHGIHGETKNGSDETDELEEAQLAKLR
jgi:cyclopropane-fatty-acyl-phospholipid synthase